MKYRPWFLADLHYLDQCKKVEENEERNHLLTLPYRGCVKAAVNIKGRQLKPADIGPLLFISFAL